MWSVQVVKFAAAAVRNSPELHEGARHTLEIWLSETQVLGVLLEVTASGA